MAKKQANGNKDGRRVAIVSGLRTPFARPASAYRTLSALDLGKIVVSELLARTSVPPREIDLCVYGQAIPSLAEPNIAREIVLATTIPKDVDAFSVIRSCATSFQSLTSAAEAMLAGQASLAVVGGADSVSDIPLVLSMAVGRTLLEVTKVSSWAERFRLVTRLSSRDVFPLARALTEPSTGLTQGESAETMAKEAAIGRDDQDRFAHQSHTRATKAYVDHLYESQIMHVVLPPNFDAVLGEDNMVRRDSQLDAYAQFAPVFDPKYGTVTDGNTAPLADGAAALLLMTSDKAEALGFTPLGYLKDWAYGAVDPSGWALLGPTHATAKALERAGLGLEHMDVVEMHEAFAAQVLCNTKMMASAAFCEDKLGRSTPLGELDPAKLNALGGSLAMGHPFGATGARLVLTALQQLRRQGGQFALATTSAAGGLGAAVILEAAS